MSILKDIILVFRETDFNFGISLQTLSLRFWFNFTSMIKFIEFINRLLTIGLFKLARSNI